MDAIALATLTVLAVIFFGMSMLFGGWIKPKKKE